MSGEISISDLRQLGRDRLDLLEPTLQLIDGAEELRFAHEAECGCDAPGTFACAWPTAGAQLLAAFDFDEEVTT